MITSLRRCGRILMLAAVAGCGVKSTQNIKTSDRDEAVKGASGGKNPVAKPATGPIEAPEISVDAPTADNPVTVGCAFAPEPCVPGAEAALFVKAKTLAGWHFYSVDRPTGVNRPTKIEVKLPAGFSEAGKWILPEPHKDPKLTDETWTYDGDVMFRLPVKLADTTAAGKAKASIEFFYQACKDEICKPPTSVTIEVPVQVAAAK